MPGRARAITFTVCRPDHPPVESTVAIERLVIAGWAGRDIRAVEAHVRELAELGVKAPSSIPVFYRAGIEALTTATRIQVLGEESSGEVEAFFVGNGDDTLVTVGSDHTDRKVEAYSIAVSKQMCPKPVCPEAWVHADVAGHWDDLVLRSYALIDGERRLYQEGSVADLQPPGALFEKLFGSATLPAGTAMYGGTLSAIGGIVPANAMELELEDPVLKRTLRHRYVVDTLAVVS